jgi:hypothetical protein
MPRFNVTMNQFDNFCLTGRWGIRSGYPSAKLLRSMSQSMQTQLRNRIVLALSSNRFYSLRGVRPGARLAAAAIKLHTGGAIHVGLNDWYMARNGPSTAVLKVRGGIVEEIGIADVELTGTRDAQITFITSF